ncbi:MAG: hypothetical protein ACR2GH_15345 [Pseudonocardia sp.]
MSQNELMHWLTASTPQRQHNKDLAALDRRTDLAEELLASIGQVQGRAVVEQLKVGLLAREATRLDPEGAEYYALLRAAGTYGMASVIDRHSRGR